MYHVSQIYHIFKCFTEEWDPEGFVLKRKPCSLLPLGKTKTHFRRNSSTRRKVCKIISSILLIGTNCHLKNSDDLLIIIRQNMVCCYNIWSRVWLSYERQKEKAACTPLALSLLQLWKLSPPKVHSQEKLQLPAHIYHLCSGSSKFLISVTDHSQDISGIK